MLHIFAAIFADNYYVCICNDLNNLCAKANVSNVWDKNFLQKVCFQQILNHSI